MQVRHREVVPCLRDTQQGMEGEKLDMNPALCTSQWSTQVTTRDHSK